MNLRSLIRALRVACLTPALLLSACAAENSARKEIRLGQISLSFYAVSAEIVRLVLEDEGYNVVATIGDHADIYPMLGAGDVDLLAASWLPNGHRDLYAAVESDVVKLAPLYEGARFYWTVPSYIPVDAVSEIEDLAAPGVVARMRKEIATLPDATGLTIGARRMMDTYDLGAAGYELRPGGAEEWTSFIDNAVTDGEWVVFPLWEPHWLNVEYDLRRLRDSKNAYGDDDTAWVLAHESISQKLDPGTLALIASIRLPIKEVEKMDVWVNKNGLTPAEAAKRWVNENPDQVAGWRNASAN